MSDDDPGLDRGRGRAGRPRGGDRRPPGRPRLRGGREGRSRQLHLPLPARHDVLHHSRPSRDRRPAVRHPLREADAMGSAALLPAGGRYVRASNRARRGAARDRGWGRWAAGRHPPHPNGRRADAPSAERGARHRLLRPSESPGRPRRGPAPRRALLRRAAPLLPQAGGGGGRQELGRHRGSRAVPGRGQGHAGPPARGPGRVHQVLDTAGHREPHQGRGGGRAASRPG